MEGSVRGVRARSARNLITSPYYGYHSLVSLHTQEELRFQLLTYIVECYEILNSRFALEHRYVAKDKFGRAVADMELYLGQIAMGQKQETGILVLLRHFKKERCGILPPNARLVMTSATKKPVWEVLDTSSQKITLSDETPSKNRPSYRAQMGVVRFMKKDENIIIDKEQTVNFRNERWPDEIRVKSPSGSTVLDGVYRRTKCMGTVCFHALWRCVRKDDEPDTYLFVRPDVART